MRFGYFRNKSKTFLMKNEVYAFSFIRLHVSVQKKYEILRFCTVHLGPFYIRPFISSQRQHRLPSIYIFLYYCTFFLVFSIAVSLSLTRGFPRAIRCNLPCYKNTSLNRNSSSRRLFLLIVSPYIQRDDLEWSNLRYVRYVSRISKSGIKTV